MSTPWSMFPPKNFLVLGSYLHKSIKIYHKFTLHCWLERNMGLKNRYHWLHTPATVSYVALHTHFSNALSLISPPVVGDSDWLVASLRGPSEHCPRDPQYMAKRWLLGLGHQHLGLHRGLMDGLLWQSHGAVRTPSYAVETSSHVRELCPVSPQLVTALADN